MATAEFALEREWESDRRGPGRWVFSHAARHKPAILGMLAGAVANALLAAVQPILIGQAFGAISRPTPEMDILLRAAILVAVTQLVRGVGMQLLRNISAETLGQRIERDVRDELYVSLIGKSMAFHDANPTGDLMARATNDVREINFMFNPGLNFVIGSANFVLMPLFVAPGIHPQLVLAPILYLLFYVYVVSSYLRQLRPASEAVRREFGHMNTTLAEAIEGVETVKGAAQETYEIERFRRSVSDWRTAFLWNGFPTFTGQYAYPRVASGLASARRLLNLINARTDLGENPTGHDGAMRGGVTFENVSFCYSSPDEGCRIEEQSVALEHINITVKPGQTVAIVGQTGSGKSTLAKLINRIHDVDVGRVLVDGIDVRDWNLATLRRRISIIEQDIFLFSRTIAENIAFGLPGATTEQIEAAARAAQAHDFIMGFADGYDTVVGERGTTLSGGQRQRIALARAFLTDPAILVLDDATSAIDSETEDRIQRAIERAAANRTTFLITHRLSQIRWADLIVVMKQGRVDEAGSHEELMASSEAYRNIFARYE